jgi:hypothetical protein
MGWYKAHSSLSTDQCSIDLIDRCINCGSEKRSVDLSSPLYRPLEFLARFPKNIISSL